MSTKIIIVPGGYKYLLIYRWTMHRCRYNTGQSLTILLESREPMGIMTFLLLVLCSCAQILMAFLNCGLLLFLTTPNFSLVRRDKFAKVHHWWKSPSWVTSHDEDVQLLYKLPQNAKCIQMAPRCRKPFQPHVSLPAPVQVSIALPTEHHVSNYLLENVRNACITGPWVIYSKDDNARLLAKCTWRHHPARMY